MRVSRHLMRDGLSHILCELLVGTPMCLRVQVPHRLVSSRPLRFRGFGSLLGQMV